MASSSHRGLFAISPCVGKRTYLRLAISAQMGGTTALGHGFITIYGFSAATAAALPCRLDRRSLSGRIRIRGGLLMWPKPRRCRWNMPLPEPSLCITRRRAPERPGICSSAHRTAGATLWATLAPARRAVHLPLPRPHAPSPFGPRPQMAQSLPATAVSRSTENVEGRQTSRHVRDRIDRIINIMHMLSLSRAPFPT